MKKTKSAIFDAILRFRLFHNEIRFGECSLNGREIALIINLTQ